MIWRLLAMYWWVVLIAWLLLPLSFLIMRAVIIRRHDRLMDQRRRTRAQPPPIDFRDDNPYSY